MDSQPHRLRVWDLPTRVFHWLLAACVIGSIVSAKVGGNAMTWHFRFGYVIFSLLLFRILWGFVGGHWSRFASFAPRPGAALRYLQGRPREGDWPQVGHNPLGALSVFAMLVFLCAQVEAGLFADDEISNTGPLYKFVSGSTSQLLTTYHKAIGQWVLIVLIVSHVAAIAWYAVRKRQNLTRAMITGDQAMNAALPTSRDSASSRLLAAALIAACAVGVSWLVSLGS